MLLSLFHLFIELVNVPLYLANLILNFVYSRLQLSGFDKVLLHFLVELLSALFEGLLADVVTGHQLLVLVYLSS